MSLPIEHRAVECTVESLDAAVTELEVQIEHVLGIAHTWMVGE
jgi:hypothetical protein